jgi:hypothetical protein
MNLKVGLVLPRQCDRRHVEAIFPVPSWVADGLRNGNRAALTLPE